MLTRLFIFLLVMPTLSFASEVTVAINFDDGGKTHSRHFKKLLNILQDNHCHGVAYANSSEPVQLLFDPTPRSTAVRSHPDYQLIAIAKTLTGETHIRGAIVVQASTGITDLNTLRGNWFSFISKNSWTGYHLPLKLLNDANINEGNSHFYFVGNNFGSAAALGHQDVQVAILAEPLAKRWAKLNNLSTVALTEAVETGGWWIHNDVSPAIKAQCSQALTQLNKQASLPAWIGGFEAIVNE